MSLFGRKKSDDPVRDYDSGTRLCGPASRPMPQRLPVTRAP